MVRKIASGMQDVDDDYLVRTIQKHQKMFSCPRKAQVYGIVYQNRTAAAMRLTPQDCLTAF